MCTVTDEAVDALLALPILKCWRFQEVDILKFSRCLGLVVWCWKRGRCVEHRGGVLVWYGGRGFRESFGRL